MSVSRISAQLDVNKSESVILVYGQVNDIFITGDLLLYNRDGIDRILWHILKEQGFDQIVYFNSPRSLYAYDQQSCQLCSPSYIRRFLNEKEVNPAGPAQPRGNSNDGRPLGRRLLGSRRSREQQTDGIENFEGNSSPGRRCSEESRHFEGYLPIMTNEVDILECMNRCMNGEDIKSAVVFSQFAPRKGGIQSTSVLNDLLGSWRRNTTGNRCFIILDANSSDELENLIEDSLPLKSLLNNYGQQKDSYSIIHAGAPGKDEIKRLIHLLRLSGPKDLDWLSFERIVEGLERVQQPLKDWSNEFKGISCIDISSINGILAPEWQIDEKERSVWQKLEELTGLEQAKKEIKRYVRKAKRALKQGRPLPKMHLVFRGNPGTGKTTFARLVGEIFRKEGILPRGHSVEVDRKDLVAGYVGQTAIKTDAVCRDAVGGILFIDEAYSLVDGDDQNGFGKEAIDTLIKRMEDWQDRFVVILAGYPEDMEKLMDSNNGFESRIGAFIDFEDYGPEELFNIFRHNAERLSLHLDPTVEDPIRNILTNLYKRRDQKFGNARVAIQLLSELEGFHVDRCEERGLDPEVELLKVEDIPPKYKPFIAEKPPEGTPLERLNQLIGLRKAKTQVEKHIALIKTYGGETTERDNNRLHMVFQGNPGTGKTTVARLVAEIYRDGGVLKKGHLVEVSRADLVGQFMGRTADQVKKVCKKARDGVLFIDEAYSLVQGDNDTFGKEAIDTLLKVMEDERGRLVVILAGYPKEMQELLNSNPGLSRRFGINITFEDYNGEDLFKIFKLQSRKLNLDSEVSNAIRNILHQLYHDRDQHFGNAGEVEKLVQELKENHALRCISEGLDSKSEEIKRIDIPERFIPMARVTPQEDKVAASLKELKALIGLESVKSLVEELVGQIRFYEKAKKQELNLKQRLSTFHLIFSGNPGTGKTTVARLLGRIFKSLKVLRRGHVVEVQRVDLVAGYTGQTAIKTKKKIEEALDGILFIDEAYSLFRSVNDPFGQEAVDTILKMMEDNRDRLVVIAAGYPKEMQAFLRSNPGLASRFREPIEFEDYSIDQLVSIFEKMVSERNFRVSEKALIKAKDYFSFLKFTKNRDSFGNAREIRDFFEYKVITNLASRVNQLDNPLIEDYSTIREQDIPQTTSNAKGKKQKKNAKKKPKLSDIVDNSNRVKHEIEKKEGGGSLGKVKKKEESSSTQVIQRQFGQGDNIAGNKIIYNYGKDKLPKELTLIPRVSPSSVIGRENEVIRLHQCLFGKHPRVQLIGIGGIGKSVILKNFINKYESSFQHLIWIDCTGSIKKAFLQNEVLLSNLEFDFDETEDEDQRFIKLINKLTKIAEECLIILDGVKKQFEAELGQIQLPTNFKIILASRFSFNTFEEIRVNSLDYEPAKNLFLKSNSSQPEEDELKDFFGYIGYHTLAIEILSKILSSRVDLDFKKLLELIKTNGLEIKSNAIEINYDEQLDENSYIIDFFAGIFDMANLKKEETDLLTKVSILPSVFISFKNLCELLQVEESKVVDFSNLLGAIEKKGFLEKGNNKNYRCHQIIQEVIRKKNLPNAENCQEILEVLGFQLVSKLSDANYEEYAQFAPKYTPFLESIVPYFPQKALAFVGVYQNLGLLLRILGKFSESTFYHKLDYAEKVTERSDYPVPFSISCRLLANSYLIQGEYEDAEKKFFEGLDTIREFNPDEIEQICLLEQQLGTLYLMRGNIHHAIKHLDIAHELMEDSSEINSSQKASLCFISGNALLELNNQQEAIYYFEEALENFELSGVENDSLELGSIYLSLALAYATGADFGNARYYHRKAFDIFETHLPKESLDFVRIYHLWAMIDVFQLMNETLEEKRQIELGEEAVGKLDKALQIFTQFREQNHVDFASLYSTKAMAFSFIHREEEGALLQKKAIELFSQKATDSSFLSIFYFRMVFFFQKVLSKEEVLYYLNQAKNFLPSEDIYLDKLGIFNLFLADLEYNRNNNIDRAIEHIEDAYQCYHSLFGGKHLMEAFCLQQISILLREQKEFFKAIEYQEKVIELCLNNLDEGSEILAEPYAYHAILYSETNDLEKALLYKTKAESLNRAVKNDLPELENCGKLVLIQEDDKYRFVIIPTLALPTGNEKNIPKREGDDNFEKKVILKEYDGLKEVLNSGILEEMSQKYGAFDNLT